MTKYAEKYGKQGIDNQYANTASGVSDIIDKLTPYNVGYKIIRRKELVRTFIEVKLVKSLKCEASKNRR